MTNHAMAAAHANVDGFRRDAGIMGGLIGNAVARLEDWWTWHRSYRQTMRELGKLNDRGLDDIGIAPGDIRKAALEAANGALR